MSETDNIDKLYKNYELLNDAEDKKEVSVGEKFLSWLALMIYNAIFVLFSFYPPKLINFNQFLSQFQEFRKIFKKSDILHFYCVFFSSIFTCVFHFFVIFQHELEYKEILDAVNGSEKEKKLAAQFIGKFFKYFPDLAESAIDRQLDLCEDEDIQVTYL